MRRPYFARFFDGGFHEPVNPFLMSAEPGEGDDSGGGANSGDGDASKSDGNQDAVDLANLQRELRATLSGLQKDIREGHQTAASALKVVSELRAEIDALKSSPHKGDADADSSDKDKAGGGDESAQKMSALEKQLKAVEKTLEAERKRAQDSEDRRMQSERRTRESERDRRILEVARANGLRDDVSDEAVLRYFRPDFTYTDDEAWATDNGADIANHVKTTLPAYMKKARGGNRGGSGESTPGGDHQPTLAQLRQVAIDAGIAAKKSRGGTREGAEYNRAKAAFREAGGNITEIIDAVTAAR